MAALLGCFITVGVPVLSAQWAVPEPTFQAQGSTPQPTPQPTPQSTPEPATASLLQSGIQHYEAEQFAAAIADWTRAVATATDTLTRALLLSNLSLAHQHLGQWPQATETISTSLDLLNDSENQTEAYLATLAKALNTHGRLHWARGDLETALASWRSTTAAYRGAGDVRGVVLSLINQAKVFQTRGLHVRANETLAQVGAVLQGAQPEAQAAGFWQLGVASRRIGNLRQSLHNLMAGLGVLEESQLDIDPLQLESLRSQIYLDLGNTQRALGEGAIATNQLSKAQAYQTQALTAYQQASTIAPSVLIQLQARLNQLSLWVETEQWSEALTLWPTLPPMMVALPLSRATIYARLNFAKSLMGLVGEGEKAKGEMRRGRGTSISHARRAIGGREPDWLEIGRFLAETWRQAKELKDPIAESYAVGQLGELYELTGQASQSLALTEEAIQKTEAIQYLEGRYRWEWQLGRLLKQQGNQADAIAAYRTAVNTLTSVRDNLRFIDSELQFSFRDDVEPVYRQLVTLLLGDKDAPAPEQKALGEIIKQVDDLQLKELENFLSCNVQRVQISETAVDATAAIVYPVILEDRLAVILKLPGEDQVLRVQQIWKSRQEVESILMKLRNDLSAAPDRTPEVIELAQVVYNWLIAPFEPVLGGQVETLVFVLDGTLRNIPMAVLHDGEQYLIEKYAVAIAPGLNIFEPSRLPQGLKVFTGGVGEPQTLEGRDFSKIERLVDEFEGISLWAEIHPPLLNGQFTRENLQQQISADEFSVVHLKTHGIFSSVPEETFIVAYQDLIRGRDLGSLIQSTNRPGRSPLELLILSACSTAQGDNRAVLGLAGIAVQSGARSAISTLWEAQDDPNTQMMIRFYEELAKPSLTRAEALRQAQVALLKDYAAPHIWATYVLVGTWL
ncbi:MAG: CHAT domain-containing protein [Cyanobacteria bacterium J06635_1]